MGSKASDERATDSNEEQKHCEVVCHKARRGPFTMAMVWVTMVPHFRQFKLDWSGISN
ncbi:MAG: hypothetical protein IPL73_27705 [Candidatus Obscuribacter sp.]|nr:hypothetical protein [Candidatus Obscuribacter sp.]